MPPVCSHASAAAVWPPHVRAPRANTQVAWEGDGVVVRVYAFRPDDGVASVLNSLRARQEDPDPRGDPDFYVTSAPKGQTYASVWNGRAWTGPDVDSTDAERQHEHVPRDDKRRTSVLSAA